MIMYYVKIIVIQIEMGNSKSSEVKPVEVGGQTLPTHLTKSSRAKYQFPKDSGNGCEMKIKSLLIIYITNLKYLNKIISE